MAEDGCIRPMTVADMAAVLNIERQCHGYPWSQEVFQEELANPASRIAVLLLEGAVAGFLCWWLVADELEIQDVATALRFRRRGVARRLLAAVLAEGTSAGATRAFLEVRLGNAGAIHLYREFGFVEAGQRRCYYPDGEDALLMSLDMTAHPTAAAPVAGETSES